VRQFSRVINRVTATTYQPVPNSTLRCSDRMLHVRISV
jgi:hypothetical protein